MEIRRVKIIKERLYPKKRKNRRPQEPQKKGQDRTGKNHR
jgi:hypothetical protein